MSAETNLLDSASGGRRVQRALAAIGHFTRARASFALTIFALGLGVLRELPLPASWRRTVRAEFTRSLCQVIAGGGLATTLVAAALIGIAMVAQALFWLTEAGQREQIGSILVAVLVREVTPIIVGLIVLGRSGMAAAVEIGGLRLGGQTNMLAALGLDPFRLLVLPRAVAFALGTYTLGVIFVVAAMLIGYVVRELSGAGAMTAWQFFSIVLGAMSPSDFAVFPTKMLAIGLLVALISSWNGLTVRMGDDASRLLARAFVDGTLAIMLTSVLLSLAL
jgi:phospholipid/cholesterol/gamma-HCH transport system permease protein